MSKGEIERKILENQEKYDFPYPSCDHAYYFSGLAGELAEEKDIERIETIIRRYCNLDPCYPVSDDELPSPPDYDGGDEEEGWRLYCKWEEEMGQLEELCEYARMTVKDIKSMLEKELNG